MKKNQNQFSSQKIITFLILTFGITALFDVPSIFLKLSGEARNLFGTASMWSPAIAAFLTKWIYKESIADFGLKWPKTKYVLLAIAIPVLYSLAAYLIIWNVGWGNFYNQEYVQNVAKDFGGASVSPKIAIFIFTLMTGTFGLITSCSKALGEEIGWRGFLVPELYGRFGYIKTSLITGIIWSVWHYTILIFGDYNNGTPFWFGLTCLTISIMAACFIFTWFTIKTGSLFPAMILHATHNRYIQGIFIPLTESNSKTPWFSDEFGIVLPLVTMLFAIYFISRRKELITVKGG
jgi:membrane protease YdiL (CAAX protease family)